MKLTDEERNSLVILQLEKAKVFLKQADEMFDLKYWDIASNRYYGNYIQSYSLKPLKGCKFSN